MKKFIVLGFVVAGAASASAQSVGQWYGEVAYQSQTITDKSKDDLGKFKTNNITLNVGRVVMDNLAIEGGYSLPSSTTTNTYAGPATIDMKSKGGYGLSVRPFVNVTNDIQLFARLGRWHGESEYTAKNNAGTETGTLKNTKNFYGFGAAYSVTKQVSIVADYKKVLDTPDLSVTMTNLGLRYNF